MDAKMWQGVIVKASGAIDAGPEARRRMATLLCYLLAAERLSNEVKYAAWRAYNEARGAEIEAWIASRGARSGKFEDLPKPVEGPAFTVDDAKDYAREGGNLEAA
jgi:hypothetical protein